MDLYGGGIFLYILYPYLGPYNKDRFILGVNPENPSCGCWGFPFIFGTFLHIFRPLEHAWIHLGAGG